MKQILAMVLTVAVVGTSGNGVSLPQSNQEERLEFVAGAEQLEETEEQSQEIVEVNEPEQEEGEVLEETRVEELEQEDTEVLEETKTEELEEEKTDAPKAIQSVEPEEENEEQVLPEEPRAAMSLQGEEPVIEAVGITGTTITIGTGGYTKDRTGFQKAFDDIQQLNTKGNKTVYKVKVPAGTYNFSAPLYVYSNTCLELASNTIMCNKGTGTTLLRLGRDTESYSGTSGFQNITIDGGIWTAEKRDGSSLIRMAHAQNIIIKNATFKDVKNEHHIEVAGINNFQVTNCTFTGYSKTINDSELLMEALEIDILGAEEYFPQYGSYDNTPMSNVVITGNRFSNLHRGVGTHSIVKGSYFENIKIQNNIFENISDLAIVASNYRNSAISGNKMTNVGAGIDFRYIADDNILVIPGGTLGIQSNSASVINNNSMTLKPTSQTIDKFGIRALGAKGDYVIGNLAITNNKINASAGGDGILGFYLSGSKIVSNTVNGRKSISQKYKGIHIASTRDTSVKSNTVSSMSDNGIGTSDGCNNCAIENNSSSSNNGSGISVYESSRCNVKNNTVSSNKENGISYTRNAVTVAITGNKAQKNGKHGISITGGKDYNIYSNKEIQENKGNGISVTDGTSGIKIYSNSKVRKNSSHGISVLKSAGTNIYSNVISGNGKNGICYTGNKKNGIINKNTISTNKAHGVSVVEGKDVDVKENKITGNYGDGICFTRCSDAAALKNTVTTNKKGGIVLVGVSKGEISSNKDISSNTGNGITISGKSSNVKVTSNAKIKGNTKAGISVTGKSKTGITLSGNKLYSNKTHGIAISSESKAAVSKSTISSNVQYGISISGKSKSINISSSKIGSNKKGGIIVAGSSSGCKITNNYYIKSNGGTGITVSSSAGCEITGNKEISSNKGHGISITSKSGSAVISNNKVNYNKMHGVNVYNNSTKAKIISNSVSKNSQNGISLSGKSKASTLSGNTLSGNKKVNLQISSGCSAPVKSIKQITVNSLTKKTGKLQGKAANGATIKVYVKGKLIGSGKIKSNGSYNIKIKKQKAGTTVTVVVADKKTNQVKTTLKVK